MGLVVKIVAAEGFAIHPDKTRIARRGGCQRVTGLVVNGEGEPRVPREVRRRLRAALHNLKQGKTLKEGESVATLTGLAACVQMTDRELGAKFMAALQARES